MSAHQKAAIPIPAATLRSFLTEAGLSDASVDALELHIKEAVALKRRELVEGCLAWIWSYEVERGKPEAELLNQLGRARKQLVDVYPDVSAVWPEAPSKPLPLTEARTSVLAATDEGQLASRYLQLLLDSKRREATQLILSEVDAGLSIERLYLDVFQPALAEIGRLWQINRLHIGQEHFCTAVTQAIMAQLYPRIFTREPVDRRLIAATVSGEQHEIGIRMVTDVFELRGWDTYFLSSDCPADAVLEVLRTERPHVLAIGVSTLRHINTAARLIEAVRSDLELRQTSIMVGGYILTQLPNLWQEIGADGWAQDALQAVSEATRLTGEQR